MPEQVQKQRPKQDTKGEASSEAKARTEDQQKLLDDTEALLDEIDELVRQGELVDATQYMQKGGE